MIVGIDLGTSNTCCSIWKNSQPTIISDHYGNRTIPSVVAFTNKSRYVGRDAFNQIELNPTNSFYEVKRLIGKKYSEIGEIQKYLSYNISQTESDKILLNNYSPEEISAYVLLEIKHMAEDYLKEPIKNVVITVPAYFNDNQRHATRDAAKIAGLNCVRIINEPTAAALAYGYGLFSDVDKNILVYDLGGSTLDISLLNISDGVFQVLASTGNVHLGGCDFDTRLMKYCIESFNKDIKPDSINLQKLKKACENAKKKLTTSLMTTIKIPNFYENNDLCVTITRGKFEEICNDLIILCIKPLSDIIEITKVSIDEIIMVGGATRMPCIQELVTKFFKKPLNNSINPDEAVAIGASIQGYMLSSEGKNDPFCNNITLIDSLALSLGVEVMGGIMDIIIPRGSSIPIQKTRKYTPDSDNQTSVIIKIFEGERSITADNILIGEFELSGLKSGPRGSVKIDITFSVDINGIISVTADDSHDNKNSIQIKSNMGRFTADELDELINQATINELVDKLQREKRQLYYEISDMCNVIMYNINNDMCKLDNTDKINTQTDIESIKAWLLLNPHDKVVDKKDYYDVLSRLKSKYATLILRTNNNDLDAANDCSMGTSIYNDEDTVQNNPDTTSLRNELEQLCRSMQDAICDIQETILVKELKYTLDDALLWLYVKEYPTEIEYQTKINEINELANKIVDNNEYTITRESLYDICCTLLENSELEMSIKQYINNVLHNLDSVNVNEVYDKISYLFTS